MYSYITSELPKTVFSNFEQIDGERVGIMGHSMGGHGALTLVSDETHWRYLETPILTTLGGDVVLKKSWNVQVGFCVRPDSESDELPVGSESVRGVLWKRRQGEVGRSRCDRIGEEVERGAIGCAD